MTTIAVTRSQLDKIPTLRKLKFTQLLMCLTLRAPSHQLNLSAKHTEKDSLLQRSLSLKTELSIGATSKMEPDMVLALRCGPMEPNTRVNGDSTKQTARVNSGMLMATSTKAFGKTTKQMATVSTCTSTEQSMKVIGEMICKTALVWSHGQTVQSMKEVTKKE